jgi:hypothetical protein
LKDYIIGFRVSPENCWHFESKKKIVLLECELKCALK